MDGRRGYRAGGATKPAALATLPPGYSALVSPGYTHHFGQLSCTQISWLPGFLRQDQVCRLCDAQHYVAQEFGVHYSVSGLCRLFQRLKVKLKTGRPVNIRRDVGQAEAFRKIFLN